VTAPTLCNVADAHDVDIQQALCVASRCVVCTTAVQRHVVDRAAHWSIAPQVDATTVVVGMTMRTRMTTGRDNDNGGRRC
jgi:hypothetical protein